MADMAPVECLRSIADTCFELDDHSRACIVRRGDDAGIGEHLLYNDFNDTAYSYSDMSGKQGAISERGL